MLLIFGLSFVGVGFLAETFGGTFFRHFFDRNYPPTRLRHDDIRIKVRMARVLFAVGLLLLAVDGVLAAAQRL